MKVDAIDLISDQVTVFSFALSNVSSTDKYFAKTNIGLDADNIVRRFYAFGMNAGQNKFYQYDVPSREIVMRIQLNPNYAINESVSEIRDEMYKVISSTRTGELTLALRSGGGIAAVIDGHITKFEVPYFSKVPELQLTLFCDPGMFRGESPVYLDSAYMNAQPGFMVADSLSTAPHGFRMSFNITGTRTHMRFDAPNDDWSFQVWPAGGFVAGDTFRFSSEARNKHLYYTRSGVDYNLMDKITPGSVWPILFPRINEFKSPQISSISWNWLEFYPSYWGV